MINLFEKSKISIFYVCSSVFYFDFNNEIIPKFIDIIDPQALESDPLTPIKKIPPVCINLSLLQKTILTGTICIIN